MVMRRGEPKRPTPEEEQTNREVAEFMQQRFREAGYPTDAQPVHREYGGPNTRGVLCTCEIGEDHSVNGVRLNKLPQQTIVRPHTSMSPSVEAVLEKLASGLTGMVNAKLEAARTEVLVAELGRWSSQFLAFSNTLREEAKDKPESMSRILNAESATWAQAAAYLSSRVKEFQRQQKEGEQGATTDQE